MSWPTTYKAVDKQKYPASSCQLHNLVNSLPNYVVDVQSIDVFKVRLDKFWAQQEVMFDWTADLTGTGDRSEYTVES